MSAISAIGGRTSGLGLEDSALAHPLDMADNASGEDLGAWLRSRGARSAGERR